jgi:hypothetical protein
VSGASCGAPGRPRPRGRLRVWGWRPQRLPTYRRRKGERGGGRDGDVAAWNTNARRRIWNGRGRTRAQAQAGGGFGQVVAVQAGGGLNEPGRARRNVGGRDDHDALPTLQFHSKFPTPPCPCLCLIQIVKFTPAKKYYEKNAGKT